MGETTIVRSSKKDRIVRLIDSFISAISVFYILSILYQSETEENITTGLVTSLFLFAVSRVLQAIIAHKKNKIIFIRDIINAVVLALLWIIQRSYGGLENDFTLYILPMIVFGMFLFNRVLAIIRNHRIRSLIWNILCGLFFIFMIIMPFLVLTGTIEKNREIWPIRAYLWSFFFLCLSLGVMSIAHVISISFSQMRFDILLKIVRKTFAAEILSGLVLLCIAFSFVFSVLEPTMENSNITNYWDALWYCFAAATTIGFGDFTVVNPICRILSVILGIYGIIVVAMTTSIIINFYNEVKEAQEDEDRYGDGANRRKGAMNAVRNLFRRKQGEHPSPAGRAEPPVVSGEVPFPAPEAAPAENNSPDGQV